MGTVPVPLDWAANAGLTPTAAAFQAGVGTVFGFLLDPPRCKVRQTVAQSIPNAAYTALTFTTEDYDTDTIHDPAVNNTRLTCQTAGTYLALGLVGFTANGTGRRGTRWDLNGSAVPASQQILGPAPTGGTNLTAAGILVSLSVGDFLELKVFQDSTAALLTIVSTSEVQSFAAIRWVGP